MKLDTQQIITHCDEAIEAYQRLRATAVECERIARQLLGDSTAPAAVVAAPKRRGRPPRGKGASVKNRWHSEPSGAIASNGDGHESEDRPRRLPFPDEPGRNGSAGGNGHG
jgi:hypothetical protein